MTRASSSGSRMWLAFQRLLPTAMVALLLPQVAVVTAFTGGRIPCGLRMSSEPRRSPERAIPESRQKFLSGLVGGVASLALPLAALADPPLEKFTKNGVCLERNFVGACSKYGVGDGDEEAVNVSEKAPVAEEPESELITTLKRRSVENKARNDEEIATKTFVNGQAGEFGPFSRYVPVKHKDTGRYELVLIGELDGMRKAGLIVSERGQDVFVDEAK